MNSSAVRVVAKSPSASSASAVQNESRPKNHANPGRWLVPEVRYPATSPVPRCGLDLQRMRGFNFESNECSGIVHRDEQSFLYRKRVACVNNCARLRTNGNGPRKRFGWKGTAVHQKTHMKIAEKFKRIDPCFQI